MKKILALILLCALALPARAGDGDVQDAIRVLFGGKEIRVRTVATNDVLQYNGTRWVNTPISGIGSVTSAQITTAFATQTANTVWAGPTTGGAAAPAFRALVIADIPTVTAAIGGTGQAGGYAVGDILYASGASTLSKLAAGTSTHVLTSNGAGVAPSYQALPAQVWSRASTTLSPTTSNDIVSYSSNSASPALSVTSSGGTAGLFASSVGTPLKATASLATTTLVLDSTTAQAADVGPSIGFTGYYDGVPNTITFGLIKGAKENSTSGQWGGYLALSARTDGGGFAEGLRITPAGLTAFGGGMSSSFPALKRSSAVLQVRLADDSAFTDMKASVLSATATSNQVVLQSEGVTGTLSWTPASSNKTLTLPNLTGTVLTTASTTDVSTAIDTAFGSTRGQILYRGASGWAALSPGTSTHVLTSNGAGADPSYQAAAGGSDTRWTTSGSLLYQTTTTDGVQIGASGAANDHKLKVVADSTRKNITFNPNGASGSYFRVRSSDAAVQLLNLVVDGNSDISSGIGGSLRFQTDEVTKAYVANDGSFVLNGTGSALATNATTGHTYVPTCAGTPTGAPTAVTGATALIVDSTNHKLYFYSGGSWRDAGP